MLDPQSPRDAYERAERELEFSRGIVRELFHAALRAVDPARAVREALSLCDGCLVVGDASLPAPKGVHVFAVGKAAVAMTQGALLALNGAIVSGDVITKEGHAEEALPQRLRVHEAGHPIPDARGVEATELSVSALNELDESIVVLALISGGGSALLEAPRAGLSLADLARTTDTLLRAGAPIDALNAVRAPLSKVKAGGLRAAAPQTRWITLILSDVLGNDPRVIASGPTAAGRNDPTLALEIIERFGVKGQIPPSVMGALEAGPQQSEPDRASDDILRIVGDNALAVAAASNKATALGLSTQVVWNAAQGEAAALGRDFVAVVSRSPASLDVILGGGEATVTVRGDGRGGRNTEFALAAGLELERRGMPNWVIASLGTDGQDAMTGLAGAIADAGTAMRARDAGVDPEGALATNDSASVFEIAGGAVATGPTGTNVNDLYIAVRVMNPQDYPKSGGE